MVEPLDPSTRPTRIPGLGQILILLVLGLSFVSGALVWWGQTVQAQELVTPAWLRPTLLLHGSLNPVLCILFGWLLCHHIRRGWQMRANLISGFAMEAVFAGLILTGPALYYVGTEWRDQLILAHRVLGLLFPATLALHWISGLLWARKVVQ